MNNHTEKLTLLLGKFDDGSISDLEITELSELIEISGDSITTNLDNLLNNIIPEVSQTQIDFMDNYLEKLNHNFSTTNNTNNNTKSYNHASNNPSNIINVLPGVNGFSLNSSIIGLKVSSILTTLGVLSIATVAYFSLNWNNSKSNIEIDKKQDSKELVINEASNDISNAVNNSKRINPNVIISDDKNSNNNESSKNVVSEIEKDNKELQVNETTHKDELFTKNERIIYSEELVSMINSNNSKINDLIIKLKSDLKVATDNSNSPQQINILYQLGVIYRIKNISPLKSVELLDKAKEIALTNKSNLNLVLLSDIYGELYKSNTLLNNKEAANSSINNCIKLLKEVNSNNKTKVTLSKLNYWNNEINN